MECEEKHRKKDIQIGMRQAQELNVEFQYICPRCDEGLYSKKQSKRRTICKKGYNYTSYKKNKQEGGQSQYYYRNGGGQSYPYQYSNIGQYNEYDH